MAFAEPVEARYRKNRQRSIAKNIGHDLFLHGRENIAAALEEADKQSTLEGMSWYDDAHSIALSLSEHLTINQAAGVLAALSPQSGWSTNIASARSVCVQFESKRHITGHTGNACGKVERMLLGEDPDVVLGGRKVRSFYRNIINPADAGAVTIDRHMIDLMTGKIGTDAHILERIGIYTAATAHIRGVAREAGILPSQVQAIVWLWHRRKNNALGHRNDPKVTIPEFTELSPVAISG